MDTIKTLEILLVKIENAISRLEKSIRKAPNGNIVCRKSRGITRFFKIQDKKPGVYLGKDQFDLIKTLAQKRYEQTLLKALKDEYQKLETTYLELKISSKHKALEKFPEALKPYVTLNPVTNEGAIQKWNNEWNNNWKNNYALPIEYTYKEPYQTQKGEIVKSKSELIIADRLFAANIPYRYEESLELNGGATNKIPDFTILHPYTLETYYWEHFGLMDQLDYREKTKNKIELYALNGIIQGKNFITTFEITTSQLNTWYVDKLIEQYFKNSYQPFSY